MLHFFVCDSICSAHFRLSWMMQPRYLYDVTELTVVPSINNWLFYCFLPSEVYYHFFRFGYVQVKIVQAPDHVMIGFLTVVCYVAKYDCVISIFYGFATFDLRSQVVGVDDEEEGGQNTALGTACIDRDGG